MTLFSFVKHFYKLISTQLYCNHLSFLFNHSGYPRNWKYMFPMVAFTPLHSPLSVNNNAIMQMVSGKRIAKPITGPLASPFSPTIITHFLYYSYLLYIAWNGSYPDNMIRVAF